MQLPSKGNLNVNNLTQANEDYDLPILYEGRRDQHLSKFDNSNRIILKYIVVVDKIPILRMFASTLLKRATYCLQNGTFQ